MSVKQLIEGDCGGANPLMQLGSQLATNSAHRYELSPLNQQAIEGGNVAEQFTNEFLGQVAAPPQSFRMDDLLHEMKNISFGSEQQATAVAAEDLQKTADKWSNTLAAQDSAASSNQSQLALMGGQQQSLQMYGIPNAYSTSRYANYQSLTSSRLAAIQSPVQIPLATQSCADFFATATATAVSSDKTEPAQISENWASEYEKSRQSQTNSKSNDDFWQRLQNEWQKLSDNENYEWLSDLSDSADAYSEYTFTEDNPMKDINNAFEKGKEHLAVNNIPSAVLCFEVAAQAEPDNAEIWYTLGITQAENEMDPQCIAALKRSLTIEPNNQPARMALAISYVNENAQNKAIQCLIEWLKIHTRYKHLIDKHPEVMHTENLATPAFMQFNWLEQVQNVFIEAVQLHPTEIDTGLQEALGVLFSMSSDYDKAADCFRAALQVEPNNAYLWNRLGACLANGTHSVEAAEAYQKALDLKPGFIRVRYNIGVCCMNLKAYSQAVEHLLAALVMQTNAESSTVPMTHVTGARPSTSDVIWNTLRIIISLMGRTDLQAYVSQKNLQALNEHFKE